ncbi:MAG TPA: cyclic nucleotide-binding domain-containing protein [Solirubrobacteraceae bacterium]|jgi:CRP/FNR family transcriptional regulator, cyclic AMP receptor protein|nr:cyclic nucleotide-binding domain-containing protein [Solirubrobacteraceae bacterium]
MGASGFFDYPTGEPPETQAGVPAGTEHEPGFLEEANEREWEALLAFTQTQYFSTGEPVFKEGQTDRSLYLLTAGRLALTAGGELVTELDPMAPINEIAFLDRGVCAVTATALANSEVLRLSYDAFESLAVREPVLARKLLFDVGRIVARALRGL